IRISSTWSNPIAVLFHAAGAARMAFVGLGAGSKHSHFVHLFFANVQGLLVVELFLLFRVGAFRKTETLYERAGHKHRKNPILERHRSLLYVHRAQSIL